MRYKTFTSESVCAGHPDKICDQVSDAIVDAALTIDPKSRVAVETLVTRDRMIMAGEVTCPKNIDYENIARGVLKDLGYTKQEYNFHSDSPISVYIHQQSPEIAQGVDSGGAGDQGMMFGYACNDTRQFMPMPITLAHELCRSIDESREQGTIPYLRPDGKSEVKIRYDNGKPVEVESIVLAVPHEPGIETTQLLDDLHHSVVIPVLAKCDFEFPKDKLIVNGTGRWEIGGPASDTGVTGRKIIVDTYGGMGRHGGGCFSGKDPTKVDRSGAYACRFVAKNIVAHNMAERCEVKVAYVIGQREPIEWAIETFDTNKVSNEDVYKYAEKLIDYFAVPVILERLNLRQPIYRRTAAYGHFGRNSFPWEQIVD